MKHSVMYDFTMPEPPRRLRTLPETLAGRIESISMQWGSADTFDHPFELMQIAEEVRLLEGELAAIRRQRRNPMRVWRRAVNAMRKGKPHDC